MSTLSGDFMGILEEDYKQETLLYMKFYDHKSCSTYEYLVLGTKNSIIYTQKILYMCHQMWDVRLGRRIKDKEVNTDYPLTAEEFEKVMRMPQIEAYEFRELMKGKFPMPTISFGKSSHA